VEIVVTLSIIVILASILIAAINPNAILKRSRDVRRVQDLDTIDKAIQVMKIEISNFDELNYASQNIVYISLKDSSTTCGSYINELPSLPPGWQYRCSNSPTNIDGTGWIPFPFNQVPLLTLSKLPVDPINKPPYYYAFIVGGSFSLFTMLEDTQRTPNSKNDGDNFPHLYSTVNSNKNLINQAQGLVGYWSFDEGSGNIARDYSGNGNNGTLYGATWTTGKIGAALSFDGVDDYVQGPISFNAMGDWTIVAWFYHRSIKDWSAIWSNNVGITDASVMTFQGITNNFGINRVGVSPSGVFVDLGTDHFNKWIFGIIRKSGNLITVKANKEGNWIENTQTLFWTLNSGTSYYIGRHWQGALQIHDGFIDEVRLYNRALSDAEIKALYDATK
jgi:hypothetical protein